MKCEGMNELICMVVDGEATPEEEAELREHIASCEECRALFEAFSAFSDTLGEMTVEPPELLAKGIMYKIGLESARNRKRFSGFGRFTGLAAVILIVAVIGISIPKFVGGTGNKSAAEAAPAEAENGLLMTSDSFAEKEDESMRSGEDMALGSTCYPAAAPAPAPNNENTSDDGTYLTGFSAVTEPLQKVIDELKDETDKYSVIYLYNSHDGTSPVSVSKIDPIRQENEETWYTLMSADVDKNDEFSDTYYTGADSDAVLIVVIRE